MFCVPCRCCTQIRFINNGLLALSSNTTVVNRSYAKDKNSCCKEVAQTTGKRIEQWPKTEPPPLGWRCECPTDPQPVNYDPYRIKVPNVVVPPLPPSNAKEILDEDGQNLFKSNESNFGNMCNEMQDLFRNSTIVHPDYWIEKPGRKLPKAVEADKHISSKLGYHGRNKYKYAFHEPWKPLDRLTLLAKAEKDLTEAGKVAGVKK